MIPRAGSTKTPRELPGEIERHRSKLGAALRGITDEFVGRDIRDLIVRESEDEAE